MSSFSAAVIVLLCAHTVFGFAMTDFLRAGRHPEALHRRSLNGVSTISFEEQARQINAAEIACRELMLPRPSSNEIRCNRTWDQILCWPDTPAGVEAHQTCPAYISGLRLAGIASRRCMPNGEWFVHPEHNRTWTNYTGCMPKVAVNEQITDVMEEDRYTGFDRTSNPPNSSPANAIVEVVLNAMDSDENGEVSIAEVEAYIDGWFNPNNIQPFTLRSYHIEGKGYMLTLANLIDVNGDGNIALAELRRAAEILVNNSGNAMVGKIIYMTIRYNQRLPSFSPQTEARKAVVGFMEAADLNEDGEISIDEAESIFGLRRFSWSRNNLRSNIEIADENGDGNLSREEIVQILTGMEWWSAKPLVCYVQIYEVAGKQLADEWASSW